MSVHPVIRVFCFILFAFFLALGDVGQLLVGTAVVVLLYAYSGSSQIRRAWPMLLRMRWFFLSIVLLSLFLSPESESQSLNAQGDFIPSGVWFALHRIAALVLMVVAVQWLLVHTKRDALVSALYWLVMPLGCVGFSRERFALRIALVFEVMEPVQERVAETVTGLKENNSAGLGRYVTGATDVLIDIIAESERDALKSIDINVANTPPLLQWGWVVLLCVVMSLPTYYL